jgi:hypothetical protein
MFHISVLQKHITGVPHFMNTQFTLQHHVVTKCYTGPENLVAVFKIIKIKYISVCQPVLAWMCIVKPFSKPGYLVGS